MRNNNRFNNIKLKSNTDLISNNDFNNLMCEVIFSLDIKEELI